MASAHRRPRAAKTRRVRKRAGKTAASSLTGLNLEEESSSSAARKIEAKKIAAKNSWVWTVLALAATKT